MMLGKEVSGLERKLGVTSLAINAINITIGAGIFIMPAYVAGYLGSMSFLAFFFCSFLMCLILMCFAEMGSKVNTKGGAYHMIGDAFGPLAGFLANTLFWFGYCVLADAAILNAMTDMLGIWFPIFFVSWFRIVFIFCVIAIFALVNIWGVKSGARMVYILTTLKITPLVLLILIGLFQINFENLEITEMPDTQTLGSACLLLFMAFGGSEAAVNISGEMKDPGKTVPKGIFIGIAGILIIYILLQFVSTGILGSELAEYKEAPLAEVAKRLIGPIGGTVLIATGVLSIYSSVGSDILVSSRLPFVAAEDGLLPIGLSAVHPRFKSPYKAILLFCGLMFFMAISGGFKILVVLSSSATLLIYLGVVLAMFKSRLRPDTTNPSLFRAPGGLTVPILAVLVLVWVLSYVPLKEFIAMGLFLLVTAIFYFGFASWKKYNNG